MTGEADPKGTREIGRSGERPARPRSRSARREAAAVPIYIDPIVQLPDPVRGDRTAVAAAPRPDILPRPVRTQAAYRQLVSSGLTAAQAAGLIGYVSGLSPNVSPWTMTQINRLLFLRSLYLDSEWGAEERKPAR